MKTLQTRALSAFLALVIVTALIYFFEDRGAQFLVVVAVILGAREADRILFEQAGSSSLRWLFKIQTFLFFVIGNFYFRQMAMIFTLFAVCFFSLCLLYQKRFDNLELLSRFQSRGILGFFYVGLLPSFAYQIITLPHGMIWFYALLTIVFTGDTLAYLFGLAFGKHLLMPQVSPKKTVEGSLGGLLGSASAAWSFQFLIPNISGSQLVLLGLLVGAIGQMGDLFESMLKRVANKKDSGSLMPGHGGVLDRIDGVLFAAPLMYLGILLITSAS